jgi:hypothetical protein
VGGLASGPLPFSFYDADAVPSTAAATPPHASVHGGSQVLTTGGYPDPYPCIYLYLYPSPSPSPYPSPSP